MISQHFIWLVWHNVGDPIWFTIQVWCMAYIVAYQIPYWIAKGIREGRTEPKIVNVEDPRYKL